MTLRNQLVQVRSRPFNRIARPSDRLIIPIRKPGLVAQLHPPIWDDPLPALFDEFNVPIPPYNAHAALTQGTEPITFAATGLPTGISLDTGTGLLTGTPTAVGIFTPEFTATNEVGSDVGSTTWEIYTDGDVQSYTLTTGVNPNNELVTGWLANGNMPNASLVPVTTYGGYEISEITNRNNNPPQVLRIRLVDTDSNVDIDFFDRITIVGPNYNENFLSADADFSGPSNNIIWDWEHTPLFEDDDVYDVNIIRDP